MCFSASASFTASLTLLALGTVSTRIAVRNSPKLALLAAIPLLFGIQQGFEGIEWLGLNASDRRLTAIGAWGFLTFSHGVWLGWTPLAVFTTIHQPRKRWLVGAIALLGISFAASLLLPLALRPESLSIQVVRHSIAYQVPTIYDHLWPRDVTRLIYSAIVILPMMLTARVGLGGLAVLVGLAAIVSRIAYSAAFISVWCFFAAVLSLYLVGWLQQLDEVT